MAPKERRPRTPAVPARETPWTLEGERLERPRRDRGRVPAAGSERALGGRSGDAGRVFGGTLGGRSGRGAMLEACKSSRSNAFLRLIARPSAQARPTPSGPKPGPSLPQAPRLPSPSSGPLPWRRPAGRNTWIRPEITSPTRRCTSPVARCTKRTTLWASLDDLGPTWVTRYRSGPSSPSQDRMAPATMSDHARSGVMGGRPALAAGTSRPGAASPRRRRCGSTPMVCL